MMSATSKEKGRHGANHANPSSGLAGQGESKFNHQSNQMTNDNTSGEGPVSNDLDLVWGTAAIGATIGRTQRQAWEALHKGLIPGRLVNGKWVASRRKLREFFEESAA